MALISYTDSRGTSWRVWNVSRETLLATRTDYLGDEYRGGWLVFQRDGSDERRRLGRFPDDWASLPPEKLEGLCQLARPVSPTRAGAAVRAGEITREMRRFEG